MAKKVKSCLYCKNQSICNKFHVASSINFDIIRGVTGSKKSVKSLHMAYIKRRCDQCTFYNPLSDSIIKIIDSNSD